MSSSFKQGFPERWRGQLQSFAEEALNELMIDRRILAYEAVVTRLAEQVSTDVRVVCEFGEPRITKVMERGKIVTDIHIPINPTIDHAFVLTHELQEEKKNIGKNQQLRDPFTPKWRQMDDSYLWSDKYLQRLTAFLHYQYGEDAQDIANCICSWTEIDASERMGRRIVLKEIPTYKDDQKGEIAIDILWNCSPSEGTFGEIDIFSLQHFTDFDFRNRLTNKNKTFEESVAIIERLLATNAHVRNKALLLLQNFRHKPHDYLAHRIALEGYETLLQMEAMSTWDMWAKLKREQMFAAEDTAKTKAELTEEAKAFVLGEEEPEVLRYLENKGALDIWRRATAYTSIHPEHPRSKMVEKIPCEEYRYQMDILRTTFQYEALAAKERQVINHVFSEVVSMGYAHAEEQDRPYHEISFITGNPSYAVQNLRLNCFTGPWLIAALCLECGIPYERLFFCCVNEDSESRLTGPHSALLMRYSDGSMGYIDYGHKKSNTQLSLSHIERPGDAKHLEQLIDASYQWANQDEHGKTPYKVVGDPVHISIEARLAKMNKLYKDVHVVPLDQGFSAIQLLHTGLSLKDEGNMDAALEAFELGLTFFPSSPDLLCQCAIIHYERGDIRRAEWLVDLALHEYKNHLLSLFYKAKIYHVQGKIEDAAILFSRVEFDPREIWGDKSIKVQALRYGLKNQLEVVLPEAIKQLSNKSGGDGQSILTRCETHLL